MAVKQKILIVDDKPENLYVLEKLLSDEDIDIIRATHGNDALIASLNHEFALAILDVQMPGMDGYELAEYLRGEEKTRLLPIIFMSAAYTDDHHRFRGYDVGAVDYITKPYDPRILVSKMKIFLQLDRQRTELLQKEEALRSARDELELKVKDRTADLLAANKALQESEMRLEHLVEERTKALREAQDQLIRKEKLATLGQLAGGVGHELRNPLSAIKNAAYFLNMVMKDPDPEVKEMLEILEEEVGTSERIIRSLLDFAHQKPPTRSEVQVNNVLHEVLSRLIVPDSVEVVSHLDESVPPLSADPDQLLQVFGNLLLNAIQAMPEGGRLTVRSECRGDPVGRPDPVGGRMWLAVSVSDTGVGIPEEQQGKIFDALYTTKARGIGLGLSLTKMLVESHGGTIEVQSEVGTGSTFTAKLPLHRCSLGGET